MAAAQFCRCNLRALALALWLCLVSAHSEDAYEAALAESAEAPRLRGSADGGDSEAAQIQQLQKELQEEEVRAQIAGYASLTAMANATKEAKELAAAKAALAKAQPALDEANANLAKAQQRITDLEAMLADVKKQAQEADNSAQASSKRADVAAAQIQEAQAAKAQAESRAKAAEEKEAQEQQLAQAANNAAKAAVQREAATKAAAKEAERRGAKVQVPPVSDFALIGLLRSCPYQPVLGLVLGVAGLFSIVDGAQFFQIVCVTVLASAAGTCVCGELVAFGSDLSLLDNVAVGAEAALVTAVACWYGLDGTQIIAGALLGLALAYATCGHFIADHFPHNQLAEVGWYAAAALFGAVVMFFGGKHAHAVVGPLMGGLLFASFIVYIAAFIVASSDASSAKFLDFVEALLNGRGAFEMFGEKATVAWIAGGSIWMVVLLLGASRYFFQWPCKKSSEKSSERQSKRSGRTDRTEPLLPPSARSARDGDRRQEEVATPSRSEGRSSGRSSKSNKALSRGAQYNMYGQVGDVPEDVKENARKIQAKFQKYVPETFQKYVQRG